MSADNGSVTCRTTIVIAAAPVGYDVTIVPEFDHRDFDGHFDRVEHARSYAQGLRIGTGWILDDRTGGKVVVNQLNHAQWHVLFPSGRASGVTHYVDALTYALIVASEEGWAVETETLDGSRLLMMQPSNAPIGGDA